MKRIAAFPGILLMTLVSGCFYEIRDELTECKINCATSRSARAAWSNTEWACMGMGCPHSFKEGFMSGYKNVANGGTGCPPAVPVIRSCNHMWMDRCSDSQKMEAWYDGFEIGVIAARGDGMSDANRITTRMPQSTPIDYSAATQPQGYTGSPNTLPDSEVPPTPTSNVPAVPGAAPGNLGGAQTYNPPGNSLQ
jgi:hypothetical protein